MKKKIVFFSLGIILILYLLINWKEIGLKMQIKIQCWSEYHKEFSLEEVQIDEDYKFIYIIFKGDGFYDENKKDTAMLIYNEMNDIFFENETRKYYNTLSYIAQICPYVSELYINHIEYDSLEEFKQFTNLKEIYCFEDAITVKEEEYILSLFPSCELDWSGKKD